MRRRGLLRRRAGASGPKPPPEERLEDVAAPAAVDAVDEALRALGPRAVAGAWPASRGTELLLWIPFLRAAARRHGIEIVEGGSGPVVAAQLAERLAAGFLADSEPVAPLLERLDFALVPGTERGPLVTRALDELQIAVVEGRPVIALLTPAEAATPELALAYRAARALGTPLTVLAPEQVGLAAAIALSASR